MDKIITLSDNLIGAIVPQDASDMQIESYNKAHQYMDYHINDGEKYGLVNLPSGKWEKVNEVTADKISFNPQPFVEVFSITRLNMFGYKDYAKSESGNTDFTCTNPQDSFRSLLASKDIYWVNPDGEEPTREDYALISDEIFYNDKKEW